MEEKKTESQTEPEKQKETPEEKAVPESQAEQRADGAAAAEPEKVAEEPAPLTLEELLAESQEEAEKNRDLYVRARADLENYRKRVQREKEDLLRFGNENIIRELLPVLDNLERAVEHARSESSESQGLLEGVEMTISQFQKALEKFGASTFSALGEFFDPGRHEAMGQIETEDQPPNTVVQELQKGCLLNDRLLRPAMVMVARAPEKKSTPDIEKD